MDENSLLIVMMVILLALVLVISWVMMRIFKARREKQAGVVAQANTPKAIAALPVDAQVERMRKSIRSWAWVQLLFGILSFALAGTLSAPWGVIQILIGLASFYFYSDYVMFIVYAGAFAWAAVTNLLAGALSGSAWAFGGILQVWWAFQNYQLFVTYRKATQAQFAAAGGASLSQDGPPPLWEPPVLQEDTRAQRVFPWLALFVGLIGAAAFVVLFVGLITLNLTGLMRLPAWSDFVIELVVLLGVMGVPLGIASLLAGYRPRPAAIAGLVLGVFMIMVYFGLLVLARMGR